jgi:hypothetical protein
LRAANSFRGSPSFFSLGRYNQSRPIDLHDLPAHRLAQIPALSMLAGEPPRATKVVERSRANTRLRSPHPVGIGLERPDKLLDVRGTHIKKTCYRAPRPSYPPETVDFENPLADPSETDSAR